MVEFMRPDDAHEILAGLLRWSGRVGAPPLDAYDVLASDGSWVPVRHEVLVGPDTQPFGEFVFVVTPVSGGGDAGRVLRSGMVNQRRLQRLAAPVLHHGPAQFEQGLDEAIEVFAGLDWVTRLSVWTTAPARPSHRQPGSTWCAAPSGSPSRTPPTRRPCRPGCRPRRRRRWVGWPVSRSCTSDRRGTCRRSGGRAWVAYLGGSEVVSRRPDVDRGRVLRIRARGSNRERDRARGIASGDVAGRGRDPGRGVPSSRRRIRVVAASPHRCPHRPGQSVGVRQRGGRRPGHSRVEPNDVGGGGGDQSGPFRHRQLCVRSRDGQSSTGRRCATDEQRGGGHRGVPRPGPRRSVPGAAAGGRGPDAAIAVVQQRPRRGRSAVRRQWATTHPAAPGPGWRFAPEGSTTAAELVQCGELALREPHQVDGYSIGVDDEGHRARVARRLRRETELRAAIAESQIVAYFQPEWDLVDRRIIGAEALARWVHPVDGVLAPDEFIPVAEECGLIGELGAQVFRAASTGGHQLGPRLDAVPVRAEGQPLGPAARRRPAPDRRRDPRARPAWPPTRCASS